MSAGGGDGRPPATDPHQEALVRWVRIYLLTREGFGKGAISEYSEKRDATSRYLLAQRDSRQLRGKRRPPRRSNEAHAAGNAPSSPFVQRVAVDHRCYGIVSLASRGGASGHRQSRHNPLKNVNLAGG